MFDMELEPAIQSPAIKLFDRFDMQFFEDLKGLNFTLCL